MNLPYWLSRYRSREQDCGYPQFQFVVAHEYVILRIRSNQGELFVFYQRRNYNLRLVKRKLNETKPQTFYCKVEKSCIHLGGLFQKFDIEIILVIQR
jgi:hypothetical protein